MSVVVYLRNASAMWCALQPEATNGADHVRAELPTVTRILLKRPAPTHVLTTLLDGAPADKGVVVEDVFGAASDVGARMLRMPVMVRPATAPTPPTTGVRVRQVTDEDELAVAERLIVEGFPLSLYRPLVRTHALPPRVLTVPGWRVWLADHEGRPAAAGYTFDDGAAVGLYWLVTSPEHRHRGMARAIMAAAIGAHAGRDFTLMATDVGRPLYESLDFHAVVTATWHSRPAVRPG
ncbi:GNAT family N-acetyltransferase [Asanoa sp. WMMD1127]|uniref:GNAT family N-acetyltransferase n=1 Tax=Asanoa sp. WMMD1127 TaxID=3016107 RepID=UPI002417D83A|nr:GNAT family N-acetyltransferase [Asanoa sp. WMMD1127]MDG4825305.1 GNAT family N-acetyltransferase [Asanoa sp. WMMD1127]